MRSPNTHKDPANDLMKHYPEAQFVVRVRAREVFSNCPRCIHKYRLVERSRFLPKASCPTPVPDWNARNERRTSYLLMTRREAERERSSASPFRASPT